MHVDGSPVGPTYPPCGGFPELNCPADDQICAEDPRGCEEGTVDCFGICVGPELTTCGGFTGEPCHAPGQICVDDPRDECDPKAGGADCGGICV